MDTLPPDIKMIVIDIDGTLLTPQKQVVPATIAAIRDAQKAGILITLATARRYGNTSRIAQELGLTLPLITYDGALVIQHPEMKVLLMQPFNALVAQQAVNILVQHGIQPVVHHMNGTREEVWTGPVADDNQWLQRYFSEFPEYIRRMPTEELCVGHPDPLRVVAFSSEEAIYGMASDMSVLPCSWNAIKRGNYGSAEMAVYMPGCSKASGLLALAQLVGISLANIMAIGDNSNDIEMLQAVGWGVAMGQATETVKAVADAITTSNTEDGVARAIERYALRRAANVDSNSLSRETWR